MDLLEQGCVVNAQACGSTPDSGDLAVTPQPDYCSAAYAQPPTRAGRSICAEFKLKALARLPPTERLRTYGCVAQN